MTRNSSWLAGWLGSLSPLWFATRTSISIGCVRRAYTCYSAPLHLSIRPSVPHLQQTQLQFPPHPIFESTIYCEHQSPNPSISLPTFTTHHGSASHDSNYPCTCRSPNHESPHVASRLRRISRCKPVRPTQHDKGESFELSHRKSSGAAAVFYLDGSFVKLQSSGNHESLTDNRQLACRECSYILRRFPAARERSIGYGRRR